MRLSIEAGFTLVEVLIVLLIASTLLVLGVPQEVVNAITRNNLVSQTNDLVASLNYARSEAVTINNTGLDVRGGVNITAIDDDWNKGWIVWADGFPAGGGNDKNGLMDEGEVIRRIERSPTQKIFFKAPTGINNLNFRGDGSLNIQDTSMTTLNFYICWIVKDGGAITVPSEARHVAIQRIGRISTRKIEHNSPAITQCGG